MRPAGNIACSVTNKIISDASPQRDESLRLLGGHVVRVSSGFRMPSPLASIDGHEPKQPAVLKVLMSCKVVTLVST